MIFIKFMSPSLFDSRFIKKENVKNPLLLYYLDKNRPEIHIKSFKTAYENRYDYFY